MLGRDDDWTRTTSLLETFLKAILRRRKAERAEKEALGTTTRRPIEPLLAKEEPVKAFRVSPTDVFDLATITETGR